MCATSRRPSFPDSRPIHHHPARARTRAARARGASGGLQALVALRLRLVQFRSTLGALERHGPGSVRGGADVRYDLLRTAVHAVGLGAPRRVQQLLVRPIAVGEIGTERLLRRGCRRQARITFEDHVVATVVRAAREPCRSGGGLILIAKRHRVSGGQDVGETDALAQLEPLLERLIG